MNETAIANYFSGLASAIKSVKDIQDLYNPQLAFNFNALNFIRPGENKYSEILAFFLNPLQTHGQGETFLNIFLKQVRLYDKVSPYNFQKVRCGCEHSIDDQRRIDIFITFGGADYGIAIENKVWATDQKNQLQDYSNYLGRQFGQNHCLLYLTPYQDDPTNYSIGEELYNKLKQEERIRTIGYTNHIINCVHEWSTNCQAERVRSFLLDFEQYLKKEFLGQTFMNETEIITKHALASLNNLEVTFAAYSAIGTVKEKLFKILKQQIQEIANDNGLECDISEDLESNKLYKGFFFSKANWNYGRIGFQFQSQNSNGLMYGITIKPDERGKAPEIIPENIANIIIERFNKTRSKNNWWLFFTYFEGSYKDWSNQAQPWIDIQNGQMKKKVESILKEYLKKIGDAKL